MNINIEELMDIQREVNAKVREKMTRAIEADEFLLAFNVELFEYFNAVGTWKWWKHSHEIKREKVLDELADCFAFFLSAIDVENEVSLLRDEKDIILDIQADLNEIFEALTNNFRETDLDRNLVINDLILYVGTDNEIQGILTIERFAIAIFIATLLFDGITWDEITEAYKVKSNVNIQRQVENY
jgi:dimeric dUTPase (all-alpha-NTP-PPase superfamily)